ncbi:MAG: DUF5615 family PIN-like protein [Flavobacteriales bacterium]|jgi:predicted nuclease of predicted toxin-antitoxin system|nr:DUF5615 family PIN-like protein [Flavobacteriales bacterium]
MKLIVDMCLSPALIQGLRNAGHEADHWSQVGNVRALDAVIMEWAFTEGRVLLTHDLDFNTLLYNSNGAGPSVVIVREQDTAPEIILQPIIRVLAQFEAELLEGALNSMGRHVARVRRLPLG